MLGPIMQQQQQQQQHGSTNGSLTSSIASTSNGCYGHHSHNGSLLNGDRQQQQHLCSQQQPRLYSYKLVQLQHSYTGPPFGFNNEGNYCYMISVLQSLLHTPAFINFVLTSHTAACRIGPSGGEKWCAVCEFLRYYKRYSCGPGSSCYPRAFMNRLSAISPTMRLNRQEDAHEFLRGLLDYMEGNCLHGYTGGEARSDKLRATNPIRLLFCGKLKSSVICSKCGAQSQTFDDFMDLSLCIQSSNSLDDCLQRFVSADLLKDSNAYKCEKCRTKVTAKKSFSIAVGPPILTIQLNRFQWGHNSKISRFVQFPLSLNLRPYMSKRGRPVQYDLYSVVIHHGTSTKFGHYYCYAKRNDAWWCLNDASVERISESRVLGSCPYILFYRRTDMSALVNNNNNSSSGAGAKAATAAAAASSSSIDETTSDVAEASASTNSTSNSSTIRIVVSTPAATAVSPANPVFTPRPVVVLRNGNGHHGLNNGNGVGNGATTSADTTATTTTAVSSTSSKADLLKFMSARRVNGTNNHHSANLEPTATTSTTTTTTTSGVANGFRDSLVNYNSPSPSPNSQSSSASPSTASCIRLKIHKVEGNKFSCVPMQNLQQQQQAVMQLTPPKPRQLIVSASAPAVASSVTSPTDEAAPPPPPSPLPPSPPPPRSEALPTSNSKQQPEQAEEQKQQLQASSALKRKASHDSSSPSSSEYEWVECCSAGAVASAAAAATNSTAASAASATATANSDSEDSSSDSSCSGDDDGDCRDSATAKKRSKRHHHHRHHQRHRHPQPHSNNHSHHHHQHKRRRHSHKHRKSRRRNSGGGGGGGSNQGHHHHRS